MLHCLLYRSRYHLVEKEHDSGEGNYILRIVYQSPIFPSFPLGKGWWGSRLWRVLVPLSSYEVVILFYSRRFTLVWGQRGPGPCCHGPGHHRACRHHEGHVLRLEQYQHHQWEGGLHQQAEPSRGHLEVLFTRNSSSLSCVLNHCVRTY